MSSFISRLQSGESFAADGATGTNLQQIGLTSGKHTEDWVLEEPDRILELERSFVTAGADIILTCTFGGSRPRLRGSPHADRAEELNRRAAALARQAAESGQGVLVGGSMGPLGQLLAPYGPLSADEARAAYAEQAAALASGGVDLLVIETQFSMDEASIAVEAAKRATDLPIVVSFSYDRGTRTMMGVKPTDVATKFKELGAAAIGVNCGTTLENALAILRDYATAVPSFPLWAKPNAGLPRLEGTATIYDVSPIEMGKFALEAKKLGARIVGGCCGSTPSHVDSIARTVHTS
jgi:5-methyltetrahydrofolate--homocysteine methyltransferase